MDEIRIAQLLAIGEGELECFGAEMDVLGAVVPELAEVVAFEQVEHDEFGRPWVDERFLYTSYPRWVIETGVSTCAVYAAKSS